MMWGRIGGANGALSNCRPGSYGASSGATSTRITSAARAITGARLAHRSRTAAKAGSRTVRPLDPRIRERVRDVGGEHAGRQEGGPRGGAPGDEVRIASVDRV